MKIKILISIFTLSFCFVNAQKKPNVIFIAIDDLNDWVGCFGGHPQVKTPNIDKFAKSGLVMFKAYAPSTVCCPSRTAILTGKHATNTGVYGNAQDLEDAPKAKDLTTLPKYFENNGYHTLSTGKIFHVHGGDLSKYFTERVETKGKGGVLWSEKPTVPGIKSGGTDFAWGATTATAEETKDFNAAKWATEQLNRDFDGKPFFLALGISKPHLAWFVPQKFYDMYPLDKLIPVSLQRDDLEDIKDAKGKQIFNADDRWLIADKANKHKEAQQAYLACVSYVDYCLGQLFDALEKSKYADNTIVMLWGDHGWHLGEKMKYGKTDLWEESCRVPFIVKAPGVTPKKGGVSNGVVNLIDMYPTLTELCGLPPNKENDGRSFAKLLAKPNMKWDEATLSTYQFKNHSLTDGRYRYTWYGGRANGAEELYDHSVDPLEHTNLATNPKFKGEMDRLKKYLPTHHEPTSPSKGGGGENESDDKKAKKEEKSK
jgi:arylsulfatase A-like enzyme